MSKGGMATTKQLHMLEKGFKRTGWEVNEAQEMSK